MKTQARKLSFGIADIALIVTCAFWALNFVITKSAAGDDPDQFRLFVYNLIRFPLAGGLLMITALVMGHEVIPRGPYRWKLPLMSFVGTFLYQIFYMTGQNITTSGNIGIIYGSSPLMIVLLSLLFRIDRTHIATVAGVIIGFAGLSLVLFEGGSLNMDLGSFLMILATLCWAFYAVFAKPVLDALPPIVVTAWMLLYGAVFQLPLAIYQLPAMQWQALTGLNIFYVLASAFLSLYSGYTLFLYAISRIGPARSGVFINLTPVFTLLLAVVVRHDTIRTIQIAGLAVILAGIAITRIRIRGDAS